MKITTCWTSWIVPVAARVHNGQSPYNAPLNPIRPISPILPLLPGHRNPKAARCMARENAPFIAMVKICERVARKCPVGPFPSVEVSRPIVAAGVSWR